MGNRKSSPTMIGLAAVNSKSAPHSFGIYPNVIISDQRRSKWTLTERDITFLISQTGKRFEYYIRIKIN